MTKETALRRLENRTNSLARLCLMNAPDIIIQNAERLVDEAAAWVDNPPPEIPD